MGTGKESGHWWVGEKYTSVTMKQGEIVTEIRLEKLDWKNQSNETI